MRTVTRPWRTPKLLLAAVCLLLAAYGIGFATARSINAAEDPAPPAYMVVSSKLLNSEAIAKYREAAGPLARAAGLEILARGTRDQLTVLEGEWPYAEGITIERFPSMKALTDFWNSEAYREAKKLREGASQINFIVALAGTPPAQ
jgi:uncharacterized protein (DUF1330 family)